MDNAVDIWVSIKDFVKFLLICNIKFVELRPLAADELNAIQDLIRGIVEVVCDYNFVIRFQKCEGSERANVTGPTVETTLI